MTSLLLIGAAVPIAQEASRYFETVFRSREETFNFDIVGARAAEMESVLNDLAFKARLTGGSLSHTEGDASFVWPHEKNFFGIELRNADNKVIARKWNDKQITEVCGCEVTTVTKSVELDRINFDWADDRQVDVRTATVKDGPPMFAIALPMKRDEEGNVHRSLVAYIGLGAIQKPFSEARERTFFAVDRMGYLLGHTNDEALTKRYKLSDYETIRLAEKSRLPRGQKRIESSVSGSRVYSAFAKTSYGVTIFSEVPEDIILEPAREVRRKVILIVGITLSLALFVVFLFSITLTRPIENLMKLTRAYSKGRVLSLEKFRQSRRWIDDEVGTLTRIFEKMLIGLRERDLMKSLFRKFHGSSIADRILKGNVSLMGVKRVAIVLFCDLRGFTTYSEKNEPEEVFKMLNEYFSIMVDVISSHGGLVDKFIGDAILAVWGAPVGSDSDASDAVRACLKMRLALDRLNRRRIERNEDPLFMGMALNSGLVMSGTVGSNERMEFTVIGNTVNTASRLEGMTKYFGTDLIISESVAKMVSAEFNVDYIGEVILRGQSEPSKMYEVLGVKGFAGELGNDVSTPYSKFERVKRVDGEKDEDLVRTLPLDLVEPLKEAQALINERTDKFLDLHTTIRRIITSYVDGYLRNYQVQIRSALPADVIAAVTARDQGVCQAKHPKGEGICGSTNMVQMHHLMRPSEGGENITENLITLCYEHQREWAKRKLRKVS